MKIISNGTFFDQLSQNSKIKNTQKLSKSQGSTPIIVRQIRRVTAHVIDCVMKHSIPKYDQKLFPPHPFRYLFFSFGVFFLARLLFFFCLDVEFFRVPVRSFVRFLPEAKQNVFLPFHLRVCDPRSPRQIVRSSF